MPKESDPAAAAEFRAAQISARDSERSLLRDNPDEWMDAMIQRLFLETGKQLACVEKTKAHVVADQAQHARTLASLERTLERLGHMQSQRLTREQKVAMSDDELRENLHGRVFAGEGAEGSAPDSEGDTAR